MKCGSEMSFDMRNATLKQPTVAKGLTLQVMRLANFQNPTPSDVDFIEQCSYHCRVAFSESLIK